MTIDEEAAKVAQEVIDCVGNDGDWFDKDQAVEVIAAFGRRCAEAMREECAKAVCSYCGSGRLVKTGTYLYNAGNLGKVKTEGDYHHCSSHDGKFEWDVPCKVQAIQRVEVK